MIDAQQRLIRRQRQALGVIDADQQRTDQTRSARHGDGVKLRRGHAGVVQRLIDDVADRLDVGARGEFREDAAVFGVQVDLRGDDVGDNRLAVDHDGGGGLVAGRFNAENCGHVKHLICFKPTSPRV